jgi:lipid-binding SYLF domain-containing protein
MDHLKKLGDKGWAVLDVIGRQGNDLANKFGAEAFWPMSLDKESDKAAAILRTFTRDGFQLKSRDRKGNNTKSFVKIPSSVLQQAQGLAIFTVFRTGLHLSGASGSGILIARQPDGSFGPPSGILLHTVGIGFLIGIDIYDTVLVLRTKEAVDAFTHPKVSIGAELSVAAGPLGSGGALDMGFRDKAPAWAYTKSKGLYAGVALDGTIVVERKDENERFYGRRVRAEELINGTVQRPPSTDGLIATIEMAEGRQTGRKWVPIAPIYERAVSVGFPTPLSGNPGGPPPLPPRRSAASSRNFDAESPWHSVSSVGSNPRSARKLTPSYGPFPLQTDVDPRNQFSPPDNQYADIMLEDKRSA